MAGFNYASYPGYEESTLRGIHGKNVALMENLGKSTLMYLYETDYGYEEDAYFFINNRLAGRRSWFPLEDHPDYAEYYKNEPERRIMMAADLMDLYFGSGNPHKREENIAA